MDPLAPPLRHPQNHIHLRSSPHHSISHLSQLPCLLALRIFHSILYYIRENVNKKRVIKKKNVENETLYSRQIISGEVEHVLLLDEKT